MKAAVAPRKRSPIVWFAYFFLLAGITALGYTGYVFAAAHVYQETASIEFDLPRPPRAPGIRRVVRTGSVIGRIQIPRLGLSVMLVQGDSPSLLRRAVGHLPETALPGEAGNVAIAGHRDTFFRPLRQIHEGDVITIETADGRFQYEVESARVVAPTDVSVLQPARSPELTLITCYPFWYVGPAPDRFIVRARQIGN
jgi:sortase A